MWPRSAQGKLVLREELIDLRQALDQAVADECPAAHRPLPSAVRLPSRRNPCGPRETRPGWSRSWLTSSTTPPSIPPTRGRFSLLACREGDELVVRVKDNGFGIPPDKLATIFDLFSQIDMGNDRRQGAWGLGLTLVRRLVELHGGSITASSHGMGQGSEFVIRLPSAGQPEEAVPRADDHTVLAARHILNIEDNRDGRGKAWPSCLAWLGHRIDVAEDGPRRRGGRLALRPEIILIDINLPGLDGYNVLARVRAALGSQDSARRSHRIHPAGRSRESSTGGFNAHLAKADRTRSLAGRPCWSSSCAPPHP